jgi:hypothetical protein
MRLSVSVRSAGHHPRMGPAGSGRFRVESQPGKRLAGVLSVHRPLVERAADSIGCIKGVIGISALFAC